MKRILVGLVLLLPGCSTAPWADFLDHFFPAKIDPNAATKPTRGGVCDPPPGPGSPPPAGPAVGMTLPPAGAGMLPRLPAVPAPGEPPPPEPPSYRPGGP